MLMHRTRDLKKSIDVHNIMKMGMCMYVCCIEVIGLPTQCPGTTSNATEFSL